jgi:hypothetical protein
MKKLMISAMACMVLLVVGIPGIVTAYDMSVFINDYDSEVYRGDTWDATIQVFNPC